MPEPYAIHTPIETSLPVIQESIRTGRRLSEFVLIEKDRNTTKAVDIATEKSVFVKRFWTQRDLNLTVAASHLLRYDVGLYVPVHEAVENDAVPIWRGLNNDGSYAIAEWLDGNIISDYLEQIGPSMTQEALDVIRRTTHLIDDILLPLTQGIKISDGRIIFYDHEDAGGFAHNLFLTREGRIAIIDVSGMDFYVGERIPRYAQGGKKEGRKAWVKNLIVGVYGNRNLTREQKTSLTQDFDIEGDPEITFLRDFYSNAIPTIRSYAM